MNNIDSLTLQLLTSKKKYNNYLSTSDPAKAQSNKDYAADVKKNRMRIQSLLGAYLDNPEKQTTNEVDNAIELCFKSLLRHFSIRDREDKSARHDYDEDDSTDEDDTMFKTEEDENADEEDSHTDYVAPTTQSLWGLNTDRDAYKNTDRDVCKIKSKPLPMQTPLTKRQKNAFAIMQSAGMQGPKQIKRAAIQNLDK